MTHSLHRTGEHLENEIVFILTPSKGINSEGAIDLIRSFLDIIISHQPVHYGDDRVGNLYTAGYSEIVQKLEDVTNIHAVYYDLNKACRVLEDIVEAGLGLSVTVSGLFRSAQSCCESAGLSYHSIEHSLGIWGNKSCLPDEKTLDVLTMCGHGLVSADLIHVLAEDVRKNLKTASEAAKVMARLCLCGIFNTERAAVLLKELAVATTAKKDLKSGE